MTDDGFLGAGSLHCIFHPVHEWQVLRFIPQFLIRLHEGIHETVGRIVDVLEFAVGVRGLVGNLLASPVIASHWYSVTSGAISF